MSSFDSPWHHAPLCLRFWMRPVSRHLFSCGDLNCYPGQTVKWALSWKSWDQAWEEEVCTRSKSTSKKKTSPLVNKTTIWSICVENIDLWENLWRLHDTSVGHRSEANASYLPPHHNAAPAPSAGTPDIGGNRSLADWELDSPSHDQVRKHPKPSNTNLHSPTTALHELRRTLAQFVDDWLTVVMIFIMMVHDGIQYSTVPGPIIYQPKNIKFTHAFGRSREISNDV